MKTQSLTDKSVFRDRHQMFSSSSQPPPTSVYAVIKLLSTVETIKQCLAVVIGWEKLPNVWLMVAKNDFVSGTMSFRVKFAVRTGVRLCALMIFSHEIYVLFCTRLRYVSSLRKARKAYKYWLATIIIQWISWVCLAFHKNEHIGTQVRAKEEQLKPAR